MDSQAFSQGRGGRGRQADETHYCQGPDGKPPLFCQSFWSLIGEDITSAVLDCLNNCKIPKEINGSNITLIPKVKFPEPITNFRPISLCNVVYKIVSKVLANRLPSVISEN